MPTMHGQPPNHATLMAFADGLLGAAEAAAVERAIAQDQRLAAAVHAYRTSSAATHDALGPLAEAPVPPALRAAVEAQIAAARVGAGNVVPLRPRPGPLRRLALPLAASVAVLVAGAGGYVAGRGWTEGGSTPGAFVVAGELGAALAELPTGDSRSLGAASDVRLISSFQDGAGRFCREFVRTEPTETVTAVACHGEGAWQLSFAAASPIAESYAPAGADEALEMFLFGIEAGLPLAPDDEARALAALR
jgi:anti-sigma factor RsiW